MTRTALLALMLLTAACTGADHSSRNAAMPPQTYSGAASIPGATLDMLR